MITVKIIADSISEKGSRLTTFELVYPRFIHSEFMTHRVFSRNASSSRAIPVRRMLKDIWKNPATPIHWGKNKSGMQAKEELTGIKLKVAKATWTTASKLACIVSYGMMKLGVHKQVTNRILEPFQHIHVIVTATDWSNFFSLRAHKDAQPEIRHLAELMLKEYSNSNPILLHYGDWHLPYITSEEYLKFREADNLLLAAKISGARCARVSYLNHNGKVPTPSEDLELYNQLVTRPYVDKRGNVFTEEDPIHASPIEHQACPYKNPDKYFGNLKGWVQQRKLLENPSLKYHLTGV